MRKRIFSLLYLCVLLVALMSGCGKSGSTLPPTGGAGQPAGKSAV